MSFSLGTYYNTVIIASQHTLVCMTCHMRMVVKHATFALRVVVCLQTRIFFAVLWADQNKCAHV